MSTDGVSRSPDWKELYRLPVMAPDFTKLPQRISDASNAILDRLEDSLNMQGRCDEHQELNDALNGLRVLRKECELRVRERPRPAA